MTLDQLLRALEDLAETVPGDTLVVLQDDPEGNGYHRMNGVGDAKAILDYEIDIFPTDREIGHPGTGLTEEDRAPEEAVPIVLIWP